MPITRRLVAQDESYDNQWLKVDHDTRYIVNDVEEWQMLLGPNSNLSNSSPVIKLAAKFNTDTLGNIQIVAYLYDNLTASILNSADCVFNIYKVSSPDWSEVYLQTLTGSQLPNNYYYTNPNINTFPSVNFDGEDTIMIEASVVRLGITYRDRIYVNHLGVYGSILQLRNAVDFLDITKRDL